MDLRYDNAMRCCGSRFRRAIPAEIALPTGIITVRPMQLRPLLLWALLLLFGSSCLADGLRLLRSLEEDLATYDTELKQTRGELALTLEKQSEKPNPATHIG